MKNITKLADLKDLKVVEKPEEVKGGFFFFLFHGFNYGYQAPKTHYSYQAPKTSYGYQAPKDSGKKGGKGY